MTDGGAVFSAATEEQWEQLVRAKAKDPEAPLTTELEDGLSVKWLYTEADALPPDPTIRGPRAGAPWAIRQQIWATSRSTANAQIIEELEGGASEVLLTLDPTAADGIPALSASQLEETLVGVHLNMAAVALDSEALDDAQALQAAEALLTVFRDAGHAPAEIRGSLGLTDPAQLGFAAEAQRQFPNIRGFSINTGRYVDNGAGARDELALALAAAARLLKAGEAAGLSPAETARTLEFTLICSPDQFLEIAKFRAARKLWAKVLEHCGVTSADAGGGAGPAGAAATNTANQAPAKQSPASRNPANLSSFYARTSRRMMSSLDPWVNLLRSTTATFAAGVGGADGVTVVPFDEPFGETLTEPGPLGRRIARNTQLLLLEESHLYKVADPAGGSWYVESLTEQLAAAAWARFQEIEAQGGIEQLTEDGTITGQIRAATTQRHYEIATRKRELTGVNTFPLLGDDGLERTRDQLERGRRSRGEPAAVVRDAAQFEHLRARAAALSPAPRLLLACMGPLASHVTIAQWAKNFFEAGGVETVASGPQPDNDGQVTLLTGNDLRVAAVCPGRDVPAAAQAELVAALKAAGATRVYLAGARDDAARAAGADAGAKNGMDMVAVLGALLDHYEEADR